MSHAEEVGSGAERVAGGQRADGGTVVPRTGASEIGYCVTRYCTRSQENFLNRVTNWYNGIHRSSLVDDVSGWRKGIGLSSQSNNPRQNTLSAQPTPAVAPLPTSGSRKVHVPDLSSAEQSGERRSPPQIGQPLSEPPWVARGSSMDNRNSGILRSSAQGWIASTLTFASPPSKGTSGRVASARSCSC